MLNRTNLTLSALALSNRLNLGTRSLAANAGVNKGGKVQSIRQSHHDFMRDGMVWPDADPIPVIGPAFPAITGSFFDVPQCMAADVAVQCSPCVADAQVLFEPRPDNLAERPERPVSERYPGCFPTTTKERTTTQQLLRLDSRLRSRLRDLRLGGLKREDAKATAASLRLAAARHATTGK
jgi:hypothetical protein